MRRSLSDTFALAYESTRLIDIFSFTYLLRYLTNVIALKVTQRAL